MSTSGYIRMRWYQQSVHGTKCLISEKYSDPRVATIATSQAG